MHEFILRNQPTKLLKSLNRLSYNSIANSESDYGVKRIAERWALVKVSKRKLKRSAARDFLI